MRERSSRSSTSRCIRCALVTMVPRKRCRVSASIPGSLSVSAYPAIDVSGVFSSCETFATKSRRTASRRRTSVKSCSTTTAPWPLSGRAFERKNPAVEIDLAIMHVFAGEHVSDRFPRALGAKERGEVRQRALGRIASNRRAAGFAKTIVPRASAAITPSTIASTMALPPAFSCCSSTTRSAWSRCMRRSACTSVSISGIPDRGKRGVAPAAMSRAASASATSGRATDRPATHASASAIASASTTTPGNTLAGPPEQDRGGENDDRECAQDEPRNELHFGAPPRSALTNR